MLTFFSTPDSNSSPPPALLHSPPLLLFRFFTHTLFTVCTNCMSEVVDLSRTTVAGNLLDCEETSSYVEVYTYIYISCVHLSENSHS